VKQGRRKPPVRKNPASERPTRVAEDYGHYDATSPLRPDVGTQPRFRKKRPPRTYRYDSSLSPALDWDGQNPARELGEWLLGLIERAAALPPPHAFEAPQEYRAADGSITATVRTLAEAVDQFRRLGKPFLDWAGKAERLSFDVPTLPLFIPPLGGRRTTEKGLYVHRR
jgi:adenine-specific DNA-methyltransferase